MQLSLLLKAHFRALRGQWVRLVLFTLVACLTSLIVLASAATIPVAERQRGAFEALQTLKGEATSGVWVSSRTEYFDDRPVAVVWVAPGGAQVIPPGTTAFPKPGELYVSPALKALLVREPTVAARYPGTVVGPLDQRVLEGPQSLVLVGGKTQQQVKESGGFLARGFMPTGSRTLEVPDFVRLGAPFLAGAFSLPLLWLLVVMAEAGGVQRSRQLDAARLIGVKESVLRIPPLVEGLCFSFIGSVLAVVSFDLLGPVISPHIPLGPGVWPSDLRLPLWARPLVVVVVPCVVCGAIWLSTGRTSRRKAGRKVRSAVWGAVAAGTGAALLPVSMWFSARGVIPVAFGLVSLAFPLLLVGCLGIGVSVSVAIARKVASLARSLAALFSARTMIARSRQTASVSVGLTLLVLLSGVLISYFPLFSTVDIADKTEVARAFGDSAVIIRGVKKDQIAQVMSSPVVGGVGIATFASATHPQTTFVCGGITIRPSHGRRAVPCGQADSVFALAVAQKAFQDPNLATLDSTTSIPYAVRQLDSTEWVLLAQPAPGANLEEFRTVFLPLTTSPVLTARESMLEAGKSSRPFVWATVFVMAIGCSVAAVSLIISLLEQVKANHHSLYFLHVAGTNDRTITSALLRQTVLVVVPPVVIATAAGMGLSVAFLRMNSADIAVPVNWIAIITILALAVAPIAALAAAPQQSKLARTPPLDT